MDVGVCGRVSTERKSTTWESRFGIEEVTPPPQIQRLHRSSRERLHNTTLIDLSCARMRCQELHVAQLPANVTRARIPSTSWLGGSSEAYHLRRPCCALRQ